jgi:hypothetical protein
MKTFRFSRETILIGAILVLGFILRVWGVHFGLPFLYHADEPVVVNHALAYGMGDLNPHFFNIPPLVSYLLFICCGVYCVAGWAAGIFHSVRDLELLFYSDPSSFYLIARGVFGVFLGTVSILALYRLVKRVAVPSTALWASFFLAVNFLHVRDSHYIYVDIPLVLVLLLGFGVFFRLAERSPGWRPHLLAGAVIGLAAAVKYNGAFLAIPYLWICLRAVSWKRWLPSCLLAFAAAAAAFVLLNPYALLDHAFFMKELAEQSAANQGGLPWLHHGTYSLAGAMGWPMLILAVLGTLKSLWSRDARLQAMAVFVVAYYAVLCRFGQPYDRYVLPLIPFMLAMAAALLAGIQERSKLLFWVLIPFMVLPSLLKTVHWDRLMSRPDVRTVAKDWVETRIRSGSRLALDWGFYMPRLSFTKAQLEEKRRAASQGFHSGAKIRRLDALLADPQEPSYELYFLSDAPESQGFLFGDPRVPYDLDLLKQKGVEYVFLIEALRPEDDPFFRALRLNADRVMTFSPYRDPRDLRIHDPQTMTGGPFLWSDILFRERGGYPVSVYRLRS